MYCTYRGLIVRETINFLLEVLNLNTLLFVDRHLVGQIISLSLVFFIHLFDSSSKGLFLLLSLSKLDLNVSQ